MKTTAAILFLLLAGCASGPGVMTIPTSYLKNYPLNSVTEEQLIHDHGVPDKVAKVGDKSYLSYVSGRNMGKREYIYVIEDGVVVNLRYADQGPYSGIDAKSLQAENN